MSNLPNPRTIPFVACYDPRNGNNRMCSWIDDTETFLVYGVPEEAFQRSMSVTLPEHASIFRFGEVPPGYDTNQGVRLTVFKSHEALKGL